MCSYACQRERGWESSARALGEFVPLIQYSEGHAYIPLGRCERTKNERFQGSSRKRKNDIVFFTMQPLNGMRVNSSTQRQATSRSQQVYTSCLRGLKLALCNPNEHAVALPSEQMKLHLLRLGMRTWSPKRWRCPLLPNIVQGSAMINLHLSPKMLH